MAYLGHILNLEGRREMLFARFDIPRELLQHEYEVTELILSAKPDAYRRGYQVGPYRPDAELLFGQTVLYLERERTRKSLDKVRERIRQYDGCGGDVCWVVDTDARIKNIIGSCRPPANHYFTTYRQAMENWRDPSIWQQNTQPTP